MWCMAHTWLPHDCATAQLYVCLSGLRHYTGLGVGFFEFSCFPCVMCRIHYKSTINALQKRSGLCRWRRLLHMGVHCTVKRDRHTVRQNKAKPAFGAAHSQAAWHACQSCAATVPQPSTLHTVIKQKHSRVLRQKPAVATSAPPLASSPCLWSLLTATAL